MKKILALLLSLSSCNLLDSEAINPQEIKLSNRASSVMKLSGQEQRLAFNLLDDTEKKMIWINKLDLQVKSRKYNDQQLSVIQELQQALEENLLQNQNQVDSFRDKWLTKAQKVFSDQEIYATAFQISAYYLPAPKDCSCNKGSLYTCGGYDELYCPRKQDACSNSTNVGCGFLYLYECNGICKAVPL